ncbi:hypothetical protein NDI76_07190 [Halogeometricum sp. S1BR25-6]|uniref:DUF8048 domain-containing protein n=1 Tax=Halogeometricum salsisoli TaxID=2950536 RepID=A0ABU2GDH6_9EURY|nr:hypothetical protein [Halogeometricum sp. S1BR25-6]MDS0298521.1 hypothetical protein [Halogeometricum sp. S1BR25-6]
MPTDPRDPLEAFDDAVLGRVARDSGVDAARLRRVVAAHQRGVRALPGVDDIVYEWRRTLPSDPLAKRGEEAYFLAVEPTVWSEFIAALDATDEEGDALRAVHREQFAVSLGADAVPDTDGDGSAVPLVLTRP